MNLGALDRIAGTSTPTVAFYDAETECTIWAKLEYEMPSGSTKDRIATRILAEAAKAGVLTDQSIVVEASSGSTSISFAMTCAAVGVRFVAVMPAAVSSERLLMIRRYGGEVILTPTADGMAGSLAEAAAMAARDPNVFLPRQFANPDNSEAHRLRTGPEMLAQIGRPLDGFVAAVGTAGTLMGIGAAIRSSQGDGCALARVRVETGEADAEQGGPCGDIPGVVDCMSELLDYESVGLLPDIPVAHESALAATRTLIGQGYPVGLSSGLNYRGAQRLAATMGAGKHIGTVFCDRMERYFSTDLFADLRT